MCVCVCDGRGGIPYVARADGKWVTLVGEQTWEDEGDCERWSNSRSGESEQTPDWATKKINAS